MVDEIKVVDYGRFVYIIPKGTGLVIVLDKKVDDVETELSSLVEYYGEKVVGATHVENYFIKGILWGDEKYFDMEKWWNLFGERLLIGGCKNEAHEYYYPQLKTSDFSKEELRLLDAWARRNASVTRDLLKCDIMDIKEILRKDIDKVLRLNHTITWYINEIEDGRLSRRAFMTLNDSIMDRDMVFLRQERTAKEYDDILNVKIPYQHYQVMGDFIIRAPYNYVEIAKEGRYMGNCIGTYLGQVSRESTRIYFMRRRDDPDTPFMDIEVDEYDDLCQALMRFNEKPTDDLLEIIEEWKEENGFGLDSSFNEYGQDPDFIDELQPEFQMAYNQYLE